MSAFRSTVSINLHPGKAPKVTIDRQGETEWLEIRDEQDRELLCLFLTPQLRTDLLKTLSMSDAEIEAANQD